MARESEFPGRDSNSRRPFSLSRENVSTRTHTLLVLFKEKRKE